MAGETLDIPELHEEIVLCCPFCLRGNWHPCCHSSMLHQKSMAELYAEVPTEISCFSCGRCSHRDRLVLADPDWCRKYHQACQAGGPIPTPDGPLTEKPNRSPVRHLLNGRCDYCRRMNFLHLVFFEHCRKYAWLCDHCDPLSSFVSWSVPFLGNWQALVLPDGTQVFPCGGSGLAATNYPNRQ